MDNLQTVMSILDDIKEKMDNEQYKTICEELKELSVKVSVKKYMKFIVVTTKTILSRKMEDEISVTILDHSGINYTKEEMRDMSIDEIQVDMEQTHQTVILEKVGIGDPQMNGYFIDDEVGKIRIADEEHLERTIRDKIYTNDNKTFIFLEEL